jgi:molecular chaperone HscB
MNYFEFYDIPVSFLPDQSLVKKKFFTFSKAYHPDFFVNESEEKQNEILELSTLNNKAYQTLSNDQKRLPYVLQVLGQLEEGEKYTLPNAFLMEMMEVNETLMELESEPDQEKLNGIRLEVATIEDGLNHDLESCMSEFDTLQQADKDKALNRIKDIYFRKKYLLRIQESIDTFATRL